MSSVPQVEFKRRARRSKRLGLSVTVLVHGKDLSGQPLRELTRTLSLSADGALVLLSALVREGQTILVENTNTGHKQECRVAYVRPAQESKWRVGIEFIHIAVNFWQIYFPPHARSKGTVLE